MVERRVVQPSKDLVALHALVEKTMAKRDRKRIDFDRHKDSLKKTKEKGVSQPEEEKKVYKVCVVTWKKWNDIDSSSWSPPLTVPTKNSRPSTPC